MDGLIDRFFKSLLRSLFCLCDKIYNVVEAICPQTSNSLFGASQMIFLINIHIFIQVNNIHYYHSIFFAESGRKGGAKGVEGGGRRRGEKRDGRRGREERCLQWFPLPPGRIVAHQHRHDVSKWLSEHEEDHVWCVAAMIIIIITIFIISHVIFLSSTIYVFAFIHNIQSFSCYLIIFILFEIFISVIFQIYLFFLLISSYHQHGTPPFPRNSSMLAWNIFQGGVYLPPRPHVSTM